MSTELLTAEEYADWVKVLAKTGLEERTVQVAAFKRIPSKCR
jgi:hypothetical protein